MKEIKVKGERSTITIDTKDRFLSKGQVLLGFRHCGSNKRIKEE